MKFNEEKLLVIQMKLNNSFVGFTNVNENMR